MDYKLNLKPGRWVCLYGNGELGQRSEAGEWVTMVAFARRGADRWQFRIRNAGEVKPTLKGLHSDGPLWTFLEEVCVGLECCSGGFTPPLKGGGSWAKLSNCQ